MPRKPINDDDLRQRLGARLRALRMAAGLTQVELGARADMHKSDISRLERGERAPSLETMAALSEALDLSLAVFLTLDEQNSNLLSLNVLLATQPAETVRLVRDIAQVIVRADGAAPKKG